MTIEAWINAAANPADDGQIVAKSDGATGWQFKTSPDTGPHTFGLMVSDGGTQRYSGTVRALNTWYHFAAVYDATARTMNTYVNGVLDNGVISGTVPVRRWMPAVNVNIGRRTGGFHFNGLIDEVRIYDRALTPHRDRRGHEHAASVERRLRIRSAPTVSMTAPGNGSTATGNVTLTASASDNVAMGGVQFLLDGVNLGPEVTGSGPASATPGTARRQPTARIRCRRAPGTPRTTRRRRPPSTSRRPMTRRRRQCRSRRLSRGLRSPVIAAIIVSATDNVAVAGVQFLLDGANLGAEVTGPGPSYHLLVEYDCRSPTARIRWPRVRATPPATRTVAAAVSVTVANTDTTGPTVSVTSPAGGATVAGTLSVTASATDPSGMAGVQFLLDGANLGAEVTGAGPTYTYSWNTTTVANGTHTLSARARDTRTNTTTSASVTVTVSNDLTAPTVSLTAPTAGSTLSGTFTLRATATDNVAMGGVTFLVDGVAARQ